MFEGFGSHDVGKKIEFKVFFPGGALVKRGGDPQLESIHVYGDFQEQLADATWSPDKALPLTPTARNDGTLYSFTTLELPEGFYQYKYLVRFKNGEERIVGDPCARYSGGEYENAGVVVGGSTPQQNVVPPLDTRLPLKELVIYELHIDDFTAEYRGTHTPIDALCEKLDYIRSMGFNAIEPLPWTAWPGDEFSWGYNPFMYFSVENRYVDDPSQPAEKLSRLKRFIKECHVRDIHVIMDGVFNHVEKSFSARGFAYYWLYQDEEECPFVGAYSGTGYFEDLDFHNPCTQHFIFDVCRYWIDVFKIDGLRLDYTKGIYLPTEEHGLKRLIFDLRQYLESQNEQNFSITIEHLEGYGAIDVANKVDATSCWYDEFYWRSRDYLKDWMIDSRIMRLLNSNQDFGDGRVPTTYIENHDHAEIASNAGGRARWYRSQPHAIALLTSPGAVLMYSGQEFAEDYWMPEGYEETETLRRVVPRPKRWDQYAHDPTGNFMRWLYTKLIQIRREHPALRSPNFYPNHWNEALTRFNEQGYGVDTERGLVIYHRWGHNEQGQLDRFIIVLNFSAATQWVNIPFSDKGEWEDLLSGWKIFVQDYWLRNQSIGSNWGHIFFKRG
jgi:1,4-alpha-glucan branching enzyme